MRDLDTFLNSLVNVDRKSLIAILMSEAEKAEQQVRFSRHRTGGQREKHRSVRELLARIRQLLSFLQDGQIAPDTIDSDIALCKSLRLYQVVAPVCPHQRLDNPRWLAWRRS